MKIGIESRLLSWLIVIFGASTTLIISPNVSLEPIDQPKMFLLVPGALAILFVLILNIKNTLKGLNKVLISTSILFALQLVLVLLFSGSPFGQQFYGAFGRNTGFLTYLCLLIYFLAGVICADNILLKKVSFTLILLGTLSASYGFLQTFNHDPIKWNNQYNSILGFLGNPDFASSFMGICAIIAFGNIIESRNNLKMKFLLGIYIIASLFLIVRSHAQQGGLVFALGIIIVLGVRISKLDFAYKRLLLVGYISISTIIGILVTFGALKVGPLANHLYKISVRQRGFYWHAGLKMIYKHPLLGVGLDSYGDWYFPLRSANAAFYTPEVQSNAAHNVFIDIGSSGGFPLLILYLILISLTFISGVKFIKRQRNFHWTFTSIFAAWLAYIAQSIISINQIGIAVWGWILSGIIVGVDFGTRKDVVISKSKSESKISNKRKKDSNSSLKIKNLYAVLVGLIVGFILSAPYFMADKNYRTATSTKSAQLVYNAALQNPRDNGRTLQAAQLFASNNLKAQALNLVNVILKDNPRSYNAWMLKMQLSETGSPQFMQAREKLQKLNPQVKIK